MISRPSDVVSPFGPLITQLWVNPPLGSSLEVVEMPPGTASARPTVYHGASPVSGTGVAVGSVTLGVESRVVSAPVAAGDVRCDNAKPTPPSSTTEAAATLSQVRSDRRSGPADRMGTTMPSKESPVAVPVAAVPVAAVPVAATSSRALRRRAMMSSSFSMSFIG